MTIILRIYRAPSGQWSGRVLLDGVEDCAIAGCADPEEVQSLAEEQYYLDLIETV